MGNVNKFDALQSERVRNFVNGKIQSKDQIRYDNLFASQRVIETLGLEKIVLNGFKPDKVRAILPFTPVVYAPICCECVKPDKGWLKGNEGTDRFRRMISRDLQPAVDLFLKTYLGTTAPAINVLSLRKRIVSVKDKVSVKKVA